MMDFFRFGSKGSAKTKTSKTAPKDSKHEAKKGFGEQLVQGGAITQKQLEESLAVHNRTGAFLGQVLVDLGHLKRDAMLALLKEHCGISYVRLAGRKVDEGVAAQIPEKLCRTHNVVAIAKENKNLTVAMANPLDKEALAQLRRDCPNVNIKPVLGDPIQIESLIASAFETVSEGDESDVSLAIYAVARKQAAGAQGSRGHPRLGELLITHGIISKDQCDDALAYQKKHGGFLGQCLVKMGAISQDQLTCFLVKQLGIPYLNLAGYEIQRDILSLIPKEICLGHCLLPLDALGRTLTVAMVNPFDTEAIKQIEALHPDRRVKPVLCTWEDFKGIVAEEFLSDDQNFDESTLDEQKPEEAIQDEEVIRDAVCAMITGLFEEVAEGPKEPPPRPSLVRRAYPFRNPFTPKRENTPHLRIDEYQINDEALATIPKDVCLAHQLLPLEKMGRVLAVAMVDTENQDTLELIHRLCPGLSVRPVPCTKPQFQAAAARAFHD